MKIKITEQHKSIKPPCKFELPDFSVLTGKNGSGKTHLLEVIANNQKSEVIVNGRRIKNIRYIPFNGLNPNIQETCDPNTIISHIKNVWQQFKSAKQHATRRGNTNINIEQVFQHIGDENMKRFIEKALHDTQKPWSDLTEDDLGSSFDISIMGQNDFFTAQFALIFKDYHRKMEENNINAYYKSKGFQVNKPILSGKKFKEAYGNPPWEFINKILEETNIPYEVSNPLGTRIESSFEFNLKDRKEGFIISSSDLSTGEKILMSLALAIYNTENDIGKPDLLLIDEPDAGLHPSMTKKMVSVLNKNIAGENNIPTIITTHLPTTVIASGGVSIYQLSRGNNIPEKISIQKAVELLSSAIPFLKISNERRRQVFVECKYDVQYYELLANILARKESLPAEPIFIPARTSSGSNCSDVITVVNNLSNNGNDQVYGVIDWDLTNNSTERIIVLGNKDRYAIENYILDPLNMGLLFIRERKINISNFEGISITTYADVSMLTKEDAQIIINKILEDLDLLSKNIINYKLYNNWILEISKEFNEHQGHDLEALYKSKYPFLNVYQREDSLKKDVIEKVINDFPEYVPIELFSVFKKII